MRHISLSIFAILFLVSTVWGYTWSWTWEMPQERYSQLDFTVRAGVDRATKMTRQAFDARRAGRPQPDLIPLYRGAAAEWKKIQIQGETEDFDESLMAYVIFMQGYCKMYAGDRNEAVKIFTDLTDVYDDQDWITIPGRYYSGKSKIDMGDVRAGSAELDELLAHDKAAGHPVLAFALLDRARKLWQDGRFEPSEKLYRRILGVEFYEGARESFACAQRELFDRLVCELKFEELSSVIEACLKPEDEKARATALRDSVTRFTSMIAAGQDGPNGAAQARYAKAEERAAKIVQMRRGFLAWAKKSAARLDQGVAKNDQGWLLQTLEIEILLREKAFDAARTLVGQIKDPFRQARRRYDVECAAGEWTSALLALEEFLACKPDDGGVRWAKYEKGVIYRDRQHAYEKAIAVYIDLADPPRSLWELVWTYRAMKEMKKCRAVLNELASVYPRDAARAVWTDAQFYEQDGDTKRAIALYRRLLSQPEWKKSVESSQAHQALERFGVNTGGAMINEVR